MKKNTYRNFHRRIQYESNLIENMFFIRHPTLKITGSELDDVDYPGHLFHQTYKQCENLVTKKIFFEPVHNNMKYPYDYNSLHLFIPLALQHYVTISALDEISSFLLRNYDLSISRIAQYTQNRGFYEMLSNGILMNAENVSLNKPLSNTSEDIQLNLKTYPSGCLLINKHNLTSSDDPNTGRTYTALARRRKYIKHEKDNEPTYKYNKSYYNQILNWSNTHTSELDYSIPLTYSDLSFTIMEKLDLFFRNLQNLKTLENSPSVSPRRINDLKRLCFSYLRDSSSAYKKYEFSLNDRTIDSILHNFRLEQYVHLDLVTNLLDTNCINSVIGDSNTSNLFWDLLCRTTYLPNSFSRTYMINFFLALQDSSYIKSNNDMIHPKSKNKIIQQNYNINNPLRSNLQWVEVFQKYIYNLSYISFPIMKKLYFNTMLNHFLRAYQNNPSLALEKMHESLVNYVTKYYNLFQYNFKVFPKTSDFDTIYRNYCGSDSTTPLMNDQFCNWINKNPEAIFGPELQEKYPKISLDFFSKFSAYNYNYKNFDCIHNRTISKKSYNVLTNNPKKMDPRTKNTVDSIRDDLTKHITEISISNDFKAR